MIPPEPSSPDQLQTASSSTDAELQELDCSCASPAVQPALCCCCCRHETKDLKDDQLRRLVPTRAGIHRHRRRRGTVSVYTRRHSAVQRLSVSSSDGEPALPGEDDVTDDGCMTDSAAEIYHDDVIQYAAVAMSSHHLPLPLDPRMWSRDDVHRWLRQMSLQFNMADQVDTDRFLMNGKALCLMNCSMFLYRVPRGGDRLHADFQRRLLTAVLMS